MIVGARSIHELAARVLLGAARPVDEGPSELLADELGRAVRVYGRLLDAAARALTSAPPAEWKTALAHVLERTDLHDLALSLTSLRMRAAILGADDSRLEVETDRFDAPDPFRRDLETLRLDKPRAPRIRIGTHLDPVRPWAEVVDEFRSRKAVTRSVWDQMSREERHEAFTVARTSSAELVGKVQDTVARSLAAGESVARARLRIYEVAPRLTLTHAETVYRNAVQSAYARGRAAHMTQPQIVALRPWWQIMVVDDARTRPTHLAVKGVAMRADDSGWQATYPPFGHNCRCRVVARSEEWRKKSGARTHTGPLPDLPDEGWHTKAPPTVSFGVRPVPPPPEPPAKPDRPAAGPTLLRPADSQLDQPTRRALEQLDGFDKDTRGRLRPADLGIRPPTRQERAAATSPFTERNVDPRDWAELAPPNHPNFDSVPAELVRIDKKRIDGQAVADAIRQGGRAGRATAVRVGDTYHVIDGHELALADVVNDLAGGRGKVRLRVLDAPPPLARPFNSQKKAREELERALGPGGRADMRHTSQRVLRTLGIRSRDNWRGERGAEVLRVDARLLHQRGSIAMHSGDGTITHTRATLDDARRALAAAAHGRPATTAQVDAVSTIFHEEIHGAGPGFRHAYQGAGQWLEEAVTEISARKATRATLGSAIGPDTRRVVDLPVQPFWEWEGGGKPPGAWHPYDVPISRLLGVARKHGVTDRQVEAAAAALKGAAVDTEVTDPRSYLELFAGKVRDAGGRPGQSFVEELLSALKGGIRPMKKPMGLTRQELLLGREAPTSIGDLERNDVVGALAYFNHELGQGLDLENAYVTARALAMLQDAEEPLYEVLLERIADHFKLEPATPSA